MAVLDMAALRAGRGAQGEDHRTGVHAGPGGASSTVVDDPERLALLAQAESRRARRRRRRRARHATGTARSHRRAGPRRTAGPTDLMGAPTPTPTEDRDEVARRARDRRWRGAAPRTACCSTPSTSSTRPAVRAPSRLEGWTVGHVLTHLARNADSHTRMLDAAWHGEAVEQYAGGRQERAGAIAGRRRTGQRCELRDDVHALDGRARGGVGGHDPRGLGRPRVLAGTTVAVPVPALLPVARGRDPPRRPRYGLRPRRLARGVRPPRTAAPVGHGPRSPRRRRRAAPAPGLAHRTRRVTGRARPRPHGSRARGTTSAASPTETGPPRSAAGQCSSLNTRMAFSRRNFGHTWSRNGTSANSEKMRSRVRAMG